MPLPMINITPQSIPYYGDVKYTFDGSLDMTTGSRVTGWELVAQELWIMMISDDVSMGTHGDLAINIRQFTKYPPNRESAEIIEDHINTKISAHPLLRDLGIMVEMVPVDMDSMEIVFKRPANADGLVGNLVDMGFNIRLDTVRGVVTGLLDTQLASFAYTTNPIVMHEYKRIDTSANTILLQFAPIESSDISVYNLNDVELNNGNIITNDVMASGIIDVRPGLSYPLYDYFNDDVLDNRSIKDYHLYSGGVEVDKLYYSIINNALFPSYTMVQSGSYTLEITTENRYANGKQVTRIPYDTKRHIYPFMRTHVFQVELDKILVPGEYLIKYSIYSG